MALSLGLVWYRGYSNANDEFSLFCESGYVNLPHKSMQTIERFGKYLQAVESTTHIFMLQIYLEDFSVYMYIYSVELTVYYDTDD